MMTSSFNHSIHSMKISHTWKTSRNSNVAVLIIQEVGFDIKLKHPNFGLVGLDRTVVLSWKTIRWNIRCVTQQMWISTLEEA